MVPTNREEAKRLGEVLFYTGVPCRNGHVDTRYTSTGKCRSCLRDQAERDYAAHPERYSETSKRYRARNKARVVAKTMEWQKANPEKVRKIRQKYHHSKYQLNKDNPAWRLNRAVGHSIWRSLKDLKGGRHWELIVDFTLEQLTTRLESMFRPGMCWSNYGMGWEVDHIKPIAKCISFQEAWALDNLQPLPCSENRSKQDKW